MRNKSVLRRHCFKLCFAVSQGPTEPEKPESEWDTAAAVLR
jgi:hypothetical protein